MNDLYMRLTYEQYKSLEDQLSNFRDLETSHRTVDGGYHKAFRLHVTESLVIEFQGPLIKPPLPSEPYKWTGDETTQRVVPPRSRRLKKR